MAFQPIPQPLRDVLQGVLHANLFSTWQDDLVRWERGHPESSAALRRQLAAAALTEGIDPDHFQRLSGHWAPDSAATMAWFNTVYKEHYGLAP